MNDKINLTELRNRAEMNREHETWGGDNAGEYEQEMYYLAGAVLALIETVKALDQLLDDLHYDKHFGNSAGHPCEACQNSEAGQALNRFDFSDAA